MSPAELLQSYHRNRDQAAFSQFVQQQFGLVYSAALRQAAHDPHLARDIAQSVFTAAAQHAGALSRHPAITGWLYTTTRNQAAKHIQIQRRWQAREQKAYAMETHPTTTPPSDELWPQLEPLLDEALHALNARDREAILLRYFEGQSFADVGRNLGLAENSARMRVDRALEKLRRHLARRGLTSTAAALGTLLTAHTIQAAPVGLALQTAATIVQNLAPATLTASLLFTLKTMNSLKLATLALGLATFVTYGVIAATPPATAPRVATTTTTPLPTQSSVVTTDPATKPAPALTSKEAAPTPGKTTNGRPKIAVETLFVPFKGKPLLVDTFVSRLDLTTDEKESIQTAIKSSLDALDAYAAQYSTVNIPMPGKVIISIRPFGEGADIYDQLLGQIARTLGPARNQEFLNAYAVSLEHNLKYCGATERTVTIGKTFNSQGEFLEYEVIETWNSAYNRRGKGTRRVKDRDSFALDHPHLAKLLPADFR